MNTKNQVTHYKFQIAKYKIKKSLKQSNRYENFKCILILIA